MPCLTLTDALFDTEVIAAEGVILVDFWAEWCGPCRMIGPSLEDLSVELADRLRIAKLNIDQNPGATERYNIKSVPTMALFRDGNIVATRVGPAPKGQLRRWIEAELEQ